MPPSKVEQQPSTPKARQSENKIPRSCSTAEWDGRASEACKKHSFKTRKCQAFRRGRSSLDEFLYSLTRLNVATSRARCLPLVVASPELLKGELSRAPDAARERRCAVRRDGDGASIVRCLEEY